MGDIADGLIDGTFDEQTGEYLGEGPGYPRTLEQGYYNSIKPRKDTNCSELNGLYKYLRSKFQTIKRMNKCIRRYCQEEHKVHGTLKECAIFIQEDFGLFKKWLGIP